MHDPPSRHPRPSAPVPCASPRGEQQHPPPPVRRHRPRVLYATQGAADPPTFTLFANKEIPPSYLRYLERSLREAFDMGATPIKMRVRKRD